MKYQEEGMMKKVTLKIIHQIECTWTCPECQTLNLETLCQFPPPAHIQCGSCGKIFIVEKE